VLIRNPTKLKCFHWAWSGSGQKGHKRQHRSNASWLTKDGFGRQDSALDWLATNKAAACTAWLKLARDSLRKYKNIQVLL
jgi:hypothetical protein